MASDTENKVKARNDAYTGLLAISFLAMVGGCVLLYLEYQRYETITPPKAPQIDVPGTVKPAPKDAPPTPGPGPAPGPGPEPMPMPMMQLPPVEKPERFTSAQPMVEAPALLPMVDTPKPSADPLVHIPELPSADVKPMSLPPKPIEPIQPVSATEPLLLPPVTPAINGDQPPRPIKPFIPPK